MIREGCRRKLEAHELDVFLGKNYMVTHHDDKILALDRVWENILRDQRHIKNGADRVMWRLMDEVVTSYHAGGRGNGYAIDKTEDEVFDKRYARDPGTTSSL